MRAPPRCAAGARARHARDGRRHVGRHPRDPCHRKEDRGRVAVGRVGRPGVAADAVPALWRDGRRGRRGAGARRDDRAREGPPPRRGRHEEERLGRHDRGASEDLDRGRRAVSGHAGAGHPGGLQATLRGRRAAELDRQRRELRHRPAPRGAAAGRAARLRRAHGAEGAEAEAREKYAL